METVSVTFDKLQGVWIQTSLKLISLYYLYRLTTNPTARINVGYVHFCKTTDNLTSLNAASLGLG